MQAGSMNQTLFEDARIRAQPRKLTPAQQKRKAAAFAELKASNAAKTAAFIEWKRQMEAAGKSPW